jgi:hypothetical protein
MAEPLQTDDAVATAAAGQAKQKQKVDRVTDGRDAPWVEKYRPKSLDDVAAHKEIIDTSEFSLSKCDFDVVQIADVTRLLCRSRT